MMLRVVLNIDCVMKIKRVGSKLGEDCIMLDDVNIILQEKYHDFEKITLIHVKFNKLHFLSPKLLGNVMHCLLAWCIYMIP